MPCLRPAIDIRSLFVHVTQGSPCSIMIVSKGIIHGFGHMVCSTQWTSLLWYCVLLVARYFCYSVIPSRAEDMSSITSEYNFSTRLPLSDSYHVTHNSMWYSLSLPHFLKGLSLLPIFLLFLFCSTTFLYRCVLFLLFSHFPSISNGFVPYSTAVLPKRLQSCPLPSYLPCVSLPIPQGIKKMTSPCR